MVGTGFRCLLGVADFFLAVFLLADFLVGFFLIAGRREAVLRAVRLLTGLRATFFFAFFFPAAFFLLAPFFAFAIHTSRSRNR